MKRWLIDLNARATDTNGRMMSHEHLCPMLICRIRSLS